ncbi:alpha/beta fold hydrolase [Myxococcota bacterium]|nr:alpha/beta fold hydrolase [Myxococcota bacterium]
MELITSDGVVLDASLFEPTRAAVGAALIVPAMGVPQRFYEGFARWLAREGFWAMTFDYRGMGRSRRGSLRDVDADILTWSERDVAAALDALGARARGLPLTWIGHSLGGQIVPFTPNHARVAKIVTIASGSGFWRENAEPLRRKVWFFWYGVVPFATPLFGYFPGARLGMVGDLPRGVVEQWRRWCLDPEYVVGVERDARERFAAVDRPLTSLSFTDDEMMSGANVASLHGFYTGAPRTMRRFTPAELGVARVGHFGFFRPEMEAPLWRAHVSAELARR